MLKEETGIQDKDIKGVRLLEDFSFVTLPFEEAELVLHIFNKKPGRSIVSKARERGDK